jgi:cysteinyl-tRNA synthetase
MTKQADALTADGINGFKDTLLHTMTDDLNTPQFVSELSQFAVEIKNKTLADQAALEAFKQLLVFIDEVSGLDLAQQPDITSTEKDLLDQQNRLWSEAQASHKDFSASDKIRAELSSEHSIVVNNYTDRGPLWFRNYN